MPPVPPFRRHRVRWRPAATGSMIVAVAFQHIAFVAVSAFNPARFRRDRQPHPGMTQCAFAPVTGHATCVNDLDFRRFSAHRAFPCGLVQLGCYSNDPPAPDKATNQRPGAAFARPRPRVENPASGTTPPHNERRRWITPGPASGPAGGQRGYEDGNVAPPARHAPRHC